MNTETGEIRESHTLTEADWRSREWVPVSDRVATLMRTGMRVEDRRRKRKAAKAARRRNRGTR